MVSPVNAAYAIDSSKLKTRQYVYLAQRAPSPNFYPRPWQRRDLAWCRANKMPMNNQPPFYAAKRLTGKLKKRLCFCSHPGAGHWGT